MKDRNKGIENQAEGLGRRIEGKKDDPLAPTGETWLNLSKLLANEGRLAEAKQAAQSALDKGVRNPDEAKRILARNN